MRIENGSDLTKLSGTAMNVAITSIPFLIEHIYAYSFTLIWTGTPVGTLKLEASNSTAEKISDVNNWVPISTSSFAVSGAGSTMYALSDISYRWVRVVYTPTSSTGTITTFDWMFKGV